MHGDVLDRRFNLNEEHIVGNDTALVPRTEHMLIVVCKLFAADCADHVSWAWLRLFDRDRSLLSGSQLS